MPGADYLLPFLATVLVLSITPGPGMLYMAAQTVGRGRKAGLFSAIGTHFASYVHILAAAFGLSLVLQTVPVAYVALKVIGAGYLFWLGAKFLLSETIENAGPVGGRTQRHVNALKESCLVELTNPKSALFFIAFLPQFTDQGATFPIWLQIIVLGFVANLIFTGAEVSCVIFADRVTALIKKSRACGLLMRRLAGSIMVALGFKLLLSER
ncbi:MAG: LysE family translocator [Roseibium sp.]|uniref:LysE family translocator n=1 Tax=Roseibium sp. TaxID=1936156 RepID=UPI0026150010|nr:LysE family translocator [Roseibium sp.]MCV0425927.1 LysE family translocator [Roseibium sp.]